MPTTARRPACFIVVQHPDELKSRSTRRKIHQHVRKDFAQQRRSQHTKAFVEESQLRVDTANGELALPGSQRLDPWSSTSLSLPTEKRAQQLRSFLVRRNSAFCMKVRELCFSLALFDDGTYHFALAEMALHEKPNGTYTLPHRENDVSLRHYSHAITDLNQRMLLSHGYQDSSHGLLGVILGLASYDVSVGNMHRWQMHMAGLKLLLDNRGGLEAYSSLYFKLGLLWTDTTGCLVVDQAPTFDISLELMQPYLESISNPLLKRTLHSLRSLEPELDDIASILELMTGLAESFTQQAKHACEEKDDDGYTVYCITRARTSYLLLQVKRTDQVMLLDESAPQAMVLRETIRLAAQLFLLRLVGFTPGTVPHHTNRLVELLGCHDRHWLGFEELHLWVLIVAAVMLENSHDRQPYVVRRINHRLFQLDLSWSELPVALYQFAWVKGLLQDRLSELRGYCDASWPQL